MGGEERLPGMIRPPGGDHGKHAGRISALLSQALREASRDVLVSLV